jgi:hypothetical protein
MRIPKGFPKIGHYTAMKRRGMLPPDLTSKQRNKKELENNYKDQCQILSNRTANPVLFERFLFL